MAKAKFNTVKRAYYSTKSEPGDGYVSTTYANDAVIKKQAYSIRQVFTLLNTETKEICIDPSIANFDVFLEPFRVSATTGPVKMQLIADVEFNGTSELPVINRYGLVDNPAHKMGMYDVFSGLNIGSEPPLEYMLGSKSTNQFSGGGILLEKISLYLKRIRNIILNSIIMLGLVKLRLYHYNLIGLRFKCY